MDKDWIITYAKERRILGPNEKVIFASDFAVYSAIAFGSAVHLYTLVTNLRILQLRDATNLGTLREAGPIRVVEYDEIVFIGLRNLPLSSSVITAQFYITNARHEQKLSQLVIDGLSKDYAGQIYEYLRSMTRGRLADTYRRDLKITGLGVLLIVAASLLYGLFFYVLKLYKTGIGSSPPLGLILIFALMFNLIGMFLCIVFGIYSIINGTRQKHRYEIPQAV